MSEHKPTLVVLAAGMASRYGGNKQIEGFGPNGETIMEYSVFDAIRAGFGKVIFIIQQKNADLFQHHLAPKLKGAIDIAYVIQSKDCFLGDHELPADRVKPFGTAHALLCCRDAVTDNFAVINADDFYGYEAFQQAAEFLTSHVSDKTFGCLGYHLGNTLSANGFVTRGEIIADEANHITGIIERKKIFEENGKAVFEDKGQKKILPSDTKVSMNFFLLTPSFIHWLEKEYQQFLEEHINDITAEFLIPELVDKYLKQSDTVLKLLPTRSKWFGVTYKADAPVVKEKFRELVNSKIYPEDLWDAVPRLSL